MLFAALAVLMQANVVAAEQSASASAPDPSACIGCDRVPPQVVSAFEQVVAKHLRAIQQRDLAAYASTLNPDTTLLLPDGTLHRGKQAVLAFHREFFADRSWTQDFEKLREVVHPHTGLVFYWGVYRAHDSQGKVDHESRFIMSLTFVRENGQWLLINDQVTKPR